MREWGRRTLSNEDRVDEITRASTTIKDMELDENILLGEVSSTKLGRQFVDHKRIEGTYRTDLRTSTWFWLHRYMF